VREQLRVEKIVKITANASKTSLLLREDLGVKVNRPEEKKAPYSAYGATNFVTKQEFPIPTAELYEYLPHRSPMIWVDEVLHCGRNEKGLFGTCRVDLTRDRGFRSADGSVRTSALIEWIAQGYGYVKASHRRAEGFGLAGFGRAVLVGISDCDVNLSELKDENAIHVHVRELRAMHPAYVIEGKVTNEGGEKIFGCARITVFGGEVPAN